MRRLTGVGCTVVLLATASAQAPAPHTASPPEQPIAFSHKLHGGTLKLECKTCHPNPDPGDLMTLPASSVCLECHTTIAVDKPDIQKMTALAKSGEPIPWERVYQIPDYVYFSHKYHLAAGATCEECHGRVTERDQLFRESDISMGGCMACHQAKSASIDCTYCHEPLE